MAKFPEPPPLATLYSVPAEITILVSGTILWRIYFRGGQYPTHWSTFRFVGPTDARFDHHTPSVDGVTLQDRGILYAALNGVTCIAEVFQQHRVIDTVRAAPALVGFVIQRDLSLLDLTNSFPTRIGASMAINTGARSRARRWAQRFYQAYPDIVGIRYPSSMHGNAPAVALNERAIPSEFLPERPIFHRLLADPSLWRILQGTAEELGYELV